MDDSLEKLWSPWRSEHIATWSNRKPKDGSSLFETLLAENRDEKNLILWRGRSVFVIMNLYPYNNGHCMIVPNRCVADYTDLTESERNELAATVDRCLTWIRTALRPDGFNVGMNLGNAGGAGIPEHLHVHVVPRWDSDTNFMPTIAQTKVIPEALAQTYGRIRDVVTAGERSTE